MCFSSAELSRLSALRLFHAPFACVFACVSSLPFAQSVLRERRASTKASGGALGDCFALRSSKFVTPEHVLPTPLPTTPSRPTLSLARTMLLTLPSSDRLRSLAVRTSSTSSTAGVSTRLFTKPARRRSERCADRF
eukprot:1346375-Pleurochrysis_carterae.AAC.1